MFIKKGYNSNPDFEADTAPEPDDHALIVPDYTPILSLESLNIKEELLFAYNTAKKLLVQSVNDPLNQRAQTVNSVAKVLQHIVELQERLHNVESLKEIEQALIEALKQADEETGEAFLTMYKGILITRENLQ